MISYDGFHMYTEPSRPSDILFSAANVTLAKIDLGFIPKIPLKSGLKQFLSE